jgi:hypothetical protein
VHFEWDPEKAEANLRKHGVSFDEAASVFLDPLALTFSDPAHSRSEDREITIGVSSQSRVVFVAHCERAENLRIISARTATRREVRDYAERIRKRHRG